MKKYNEAIQGRLKYYIKPIGNHGNGGWAVVRLADKKLLGQFRTRGQAFIEWKRANAAASRRPDGKPAKPDPAGQSGPGIGPLSGWPRPRVARYTKPVKPAKKRKAQQFGGSGNDIWNRGYRMPGSGWGGRGQR